jgi:hypothetical protein
MSFLKTAAAAKVAKAKGKDESEPTSLRYFRHALGTPFHPVPTKEKDELRASSLPFCAIIYLEAKMKNAAHIPNKPHAWKDKFYLEIGTKTHELWQRTMTRAARDSSAPIKAKPFGGWKCTHCKRELPPQFLPEPCKCGPYTESRFIALRIKQNTRSAEIERLPERWRDVAGYEGLYSVSDWGRVRSEARWVRRGANHLLIKEKILQQSLCGKTVYYKVNLSKNGAQKTHSVHKLVADAFLPAPKNGETDIRHLDSVSTNNYYENLARGTRSENVSDSISVGTHRIGEYSTSTLTARQVFTIRKRHQEGWSQADLADSFNISDDIVDNIVNFKTWKPEKYVASLAEMRKQGRGDSEAYGRLYDEWCDLTGTAYTEDPDIAGYKREYRELGPNPDFDYVEASIFYKGLSGHIDWICYFPETDWWLVVDLKTASSAAVKAPEKNLPVIKNIFQIETYAALLPKLYPEITHISEYSLLYMTRDSATQWHSCNQTWGEARNKRAWKRINRWVKSFAFANEYLDAGKHDAEIMLDVIDHRPCLSEKSYSREMSCVYQYSPEGECPYKELCCGSEGQALVKKIYARMQDRLDDHLAKAPKPAKAKSVSKTAKTSRRR